MTTYPQKITFGELRTSTAMCRFIAAEPELAGLDMLIGKPSPWGK